jgi:chaperonin cofactor prefoldin
MYVDREDGEDVYYIYTNVGNLLILVTKDCKLAMQTNAALKNKKNDSEFRLKAVRDKRKAAW